MAYVERNLWRETAPETFEGQPLAGGAEADLVVVGGGITGTSAALHAAGEGLSVRLLEAERVGHGGSGRNVGLVNAGLWTPPDDIEQLLGPGPGAHLNTVLADAPGLVFGLIERHAIDCNTVRNGTLHCAHSAGGLDELRSRHEQLRRRDAPVQLLDAAAAARRIGSDVFHGALFDPRAGTIEPCAYTRGLARAATQAGARVHERTPVHMVAREHDGWRVATAGGPVRARALLLATNAYHDGVSGIAGPAFAPVHFFQFATRPLPAAELESVLPGREGCWDTGTVMSAFRRADGGRLVVGSVGALDHPASAIHRQWASRKLAALFPRLAGRALEHAWHGRIAMTSDHLPKIVQCGERGLAIFGYSGRGIAPGTAFGRAAALALAHHDNSRLPLPLAEGWRESVPGLRGLAFEAGAVADHAAWMGRRSLRRGA